MDKLHTLRVLYLEHKLRANATSVIRLRCSTGPSTQLNPCDCKTSQSTGGKLYVVNDVNASTHFLALSTFAWAVSKYATVGV